MERGLQEDLLAGDCRRWLASSFKAQVNPSQLLRRHKWSLGQEARGLVEGTTGVFWPGSFICTYLWKLNHAGEAYFPL